MIALALAALGQVEGDATAIRPECRVSTDALSFVRYALITTLPIQSILASIHALDEGDYGSSLSPSPTLATAASPPSQHHTLGSTPIIITIAKRRVVK